jgi:nitrogen fixation-related uncharacterized protein
VIILMLQIFVSLMLVAGSVVLFVYTVKSRTLEHADRLALAPLDDDGGQPEGAVESAQPKVEIKEEGS